MQGALEGEADFGGAWAVLGASTVHAAHYLGFVAVPLAAFLVGVCEYDLLHAGYLAQLLVYFLGSTAQLEPPLETAVVPMRKVQLLALLAEPKNMHLSACCVQFPLVQGMASGHDRNEGLASAADLRVGKPLGCKRS